MATNQPGDKIYRGHNFSQIGRELTLDKLWHSRTWGEILKHMLTALVVSAIPTFFDVITDSLAAKNFIQGTNYTKYVTNLSDPAFHQNCIHVGRFTTFQPELEIAYEEISCFEKDPIWGAVTVIFIILPGTMVATHFGVIISEAAAKGDSSSVFLSCFLLVTSLLLFPVFLIFVKLVGLINPGPEWKRTTIEITSIEGELESSMQLLLTLFIIFSRADRRPAWWQVASLIASIVMVTKTSIAQHLKGNNLPLMEEVKTTALLLPLFLSNGVFKIYSLAISLALLRHWALISFVLSFVVWGCIQCRSEWRHLAGDAGALNHFSRLEMVYHIDVKTDKQRMENCAFNNIFWIFVHTLVLTGLVILANCFPDTYVYNLSDLLGQNEETDDGSNNSTVSLINSTMAPLNVTTLAPPNSTNFNATTFNNTTTNSESFSEVVLHSLFDG